MMKQKKNNEKTIAILEFEKSPDGSRAGLYIIIINSARSVFLVVKVWALFVFRLARS